MGNGISWAGGLPEKGGGGCGLFFRGEGGKVRGNTLVDGFRGEKRKKVGSSLFSSRCGVREKENE